LSIEIHTPELKQRVLHEIQSRQLHDVDELVAKALDALDEKTPLPVEPVSTQTKKTGAAILAALQACPHPEIDLTPPRVPIFVRDIEL
jgi:hypothetical protein